MMLTCKKASGVATPKDFRGKTLGVWFGGNAYPFLSWMGTPDLKGPAYVAKLAKFVKASSKGWEYTLKNQDEAVKIVLAADTSGGSTAAVRKRQLENVAKLIPDADTPKMGVLDPAAYHRTVKVLLAGGSDPVIKKDSGAAAWTHAVTDKAMAKKLEITLADEAPVPGRRSGPWTEGANAETSR